MADDDKLITETWTYLGTFRGDKVAKVFGYRRPNGSKVYYKRKLAEPDIVGHQYTAEVRIGDDGRVSVSSVEWANQRADDADELVLLHRAEQAKIDREALGRNAKRKDELNEAIEPLIEIASKLKSTTARQALIDYVTRAIYRA